MKNTNICEEGCSLPSSSNELEILVRQLKREVAKLINETEAKLLLHDGKIAEMCRFIKDNLSNSIRELLDSMKLSGELDTLISEAVSNEIGILNLEFSELNEDYKLLKTNLLTKVNVGYFGVTGKDDEDCTEKLQCLLDTYKEIYIPAGVYKLSKPLYVTEGCKIHCSEYAIMKSYHNDPFIINGKSIDTNIELYNGNSNISIIGGIWDNNPKYSTDLKATFVFGHAKNITIKDCVILNGVKTHTIELAGIDGCNIDNVKFKGYVPNTNSEYVEAIQIEMCTNGFTYFGKQDFTPSKNITIQNCLFDKSDEYGYYFVSAGNHAAINNVFIENITFKNNIVNNCSYGGFRAYNFKNVKVIGNTFNSCKRGIMLSGSTGKDNFSNDINGIQTNIPQSCENVLIEDNTINGSETVDIWSNNYATDKAGSFVKNVHIKNNKLSGCKSISIYIVRGKNIDISNNMVENTADSFMELKDIVGMQVLNNIMKNSGDYALMLLDSTPATPITKGIMIANNLFEEIFNNGINVRGVHNLIINSNNIINCDKNPLFINNMCENVSISNNVLTHETNQSNAYLYIVGALNKEFDISSNTTVNYNPIQYVDVSDKTTIRVH